jgi:NAD-dependent deacetylase
MTADPQLLDTVAALLSAARRVLFVTGAGVSADSGLPTYRGVGGLYDGAQTPEGLSIEEVLSGPMMVRDPTLCWTYIAQVEAACRGAQPNAAHEVIAALQERAEVTVLTQNVDGLHAAAGSRDVIEIHGNLHRLRCVACAWRDEVADYEALPIPPRCPTCGGLVRPDVVLFGEMLPAGALARLDEALAAPFEVVFSVGTTSLFPYIAAPVVLQVRAGRPAVEINPGRSEVSTLVTHRLQGGAAATLSALHARLG